MTFDDVDLCAFDFWKKLLPIQFCLEPKTCHKYPLSSVCAEYQGFTPALFATIVCHLELRSKCSWGSEGRYKLCLKQHSNLLTPLEMALLFGCDKWYSYCIIKSNFCFHILVNSWENPRQSCFSPCRAGVHRHCNTMLSLIGFHNKITVTKLSMKSSSAKICPQNVRPEAKLVPIFPTNFSSRKTNPSPALPAFWGRVCSGEKSKYYICCV